MSMKTAWNTGLQENFIHIWDTQDGNGLKKQSIEPKNPVNRPPNALRTILPTPVKSFLMPEELPPAEDIKKLERRVTTEENKIEKTS